MIKLASLAFFCAGVTGAHTEIWHGAHVMPLGWVVTCFSWAFWLYVLHIGRSEQRRRSGGH